MYQNIFKIILFINGRNIANVFVQSVNLRKTLGLRGNTICSLFIDTYILSFTRRLFPNYVLSWAAASELYRLNIYR